LLKLVFRADDGIILGVHILGEDACELVHYGMDLVTQGVSIFKVMTTCYTAVTFHELFKEAALDGNSKLEFGLEWHKVLNDIGVHMDNHEHGADLEKLKVFFNDADSDGNGILDEVELMDVFKKYGCDVSRATVHNLVRLVDDTNSGGVHWEEFTKVFDIIDQVRSNSHFGKDKPPSAPQDNGNKCGGQISTELPKQEQAAVATKVAPVLKEQSKEAGVAEQIRKQELAKRQNQIQAIRNLA